MAAFIFLFARRAMPQGCRSQRLVSSHQLQQRATFVEGAKMKLVRDRGLDHAVEKEKNLFPLLSLKNVIASEPSKSMPLHAIAEMKPRLSLPTRAIEFVRRYPSVFHEITSPPSSADRRPRIGLTPDALRLHEDEQALYRSCTADAADRLLKLLMLTPDKKLPIPLVERLRFDLGLPEDYALSVLPDFPDYFQVAPLRPCSDQTLALELVCWSKELAVSAMEKSAMEKGEYKKGMPLAFPLHFSNGFDMEKKVKNWVEGWQKLPYISPYEDGLHLPPKSDQGEKWAVGVLHEVMHLLISKKTERDNILLLGDYMGLRSRFKRALAEHPGIFYLSNKIRTSTIVLREAYKRDLLTMKHPLMGIRYQYVHLMNKVKDTRDGQSNSKKPEKLVEGGVGFEGEDNDKNNNDEDGCQIMDSEDEEDEDEEDDLESDDEDEDVHFESPNGMRKIDQRYVEMNGIRRSMVQNKTIERRCDKSIDSHTVNYRKRKLLTEQHMDLKLPRKFNYSQNGERRLPRRRNSAS